MKRVVAGIGFTVVVIAATFIAGPSFLELGPSSACACERLPAQATEDWRRCAVSVFYNANETSTLPILNFNPEDGSQKILWRNPGDAARFNNFVHGQVEPRCGTFAAAHAKDASFQLKRALFGYDRFYIPENIEESLAEDDVNGVIPDA